MKEINDHYTVSFELYDFSFPASDISEKLNLQPTSKQTKGDPIKHRATGKTLRYAETGSWSLDSSLSRSTSVEDQCLQLLESLRSHKGKLIEYVMSGLRCTVAVGGYTNDPAGKIGVNLSSEVVKEIAEYGAEIDIDIYANSED
jgi:hypothetical protein